MGGLPPILDLNRISHARGCPRGRHPLSYGGKPPASLLDLNLDPFTARVSAMADARRAIRGATTTAPLIVPCAVCHSRLRLGEFEGACEAPSCAFTRNRQGRISSLIRTRSGCPSVSRGHERRGSRGAAPRLSLRSKVYQVRLMDINLWTAFC